MTEPGAFYVADGQRFVPTELTRGPWHRSFQHGGPVAALLGRAMQAELGDASMQLSRIVVELARPAPIAPCHVTAERGHVGRRVATLSAVMLESDRLVARASALFLREREVAVAGSGDAVALVPAPDDSAPLHLPFFVEPAGYHTAMELRHAGGTFGSGSLACWMRMKVPLVAGEETSPVLRVLVAADSGNGVSMRLDPSRYTFMNADLVVAVQRPPAGEWVGMQAETTIGDRGVGLADTRLFDQVGAIGRGLQTLVVEPLQ